VIWPEAAMPFLPVDHPAARAAIGRLLPPGTLLIAGGLRAEADPEAPRGRRIFNSLLVFGPGGSLLASYDKAHLVPFGEYLPLASVLEALGLETLTRRRGGFARGPIPRPVLHLPGLPPLLPLICYEVIFPSAVNAGSERPGLLVNLTNDGWFGNTTGPRQHMQQARVRAVEAGLPLLRAANNGISGLIDAHGRVIVELGLDQRGSADTGLPAALPPTPLCALWRWRFRRSLAHRGGALGPGGGAAARPKPKSWGTAPDAAVHLRLTRWPSAPTNCRPGRGLTG
jgi:apolipoprotein N-acyltransferase